MALWTPADLSMAAWYDSSVADSLSVSSGFVEQWNDLSGNDRHATAIGTSRPTLEAEGINGMDAVGFVNPQYLNIVAGVPRGDDMMFFGVFTRPSTGVHSMLLTKGISSYRYPFWWDNLNTIYSQYGTTIKTLQSSQTQIGTQLITTARDSTYESGWLNGSLLSTKTTSTLDADFNIIGRSNNSTRQHNGSIGEIIYFNSLVSTDDRQKIEGYLAWKWGINTNLPSGHPYYDAAPTIPNEVSFTVLTPKYDNSYLLAAQLGL